MATVVSMGLFVGADAKAQPRDPAAAQSLFDDGKRLMAEKRYAEACPKLAESERLDPSAGTVIALALCHEGEGKTATAWAEFTQALSDARRDGRRDREAAAAEHIKALEPRLVRVRVVVLEPVAGLEVKRDGVLVGKAQWSTAVAVDPGAHVFEATAPKKKAWTSTFSVEDVGKTIEVMVPPLADDAAESAPVATEPAPAPAPARQADPAAETTGSRQRTWGAALMGLGGVATAVGIGAGLVASAKWSDAKDACPGNRCASVDASEAGKSAGSAADVSTVLLIAGGAALAGGAVVYFTAPTAPRTTGARTSLFVSPWAAPSGAGVGIGGAL